MSKQGIAFDNLAQHHKRLMRQGRPAEAHLTARLLVDLADLKRYLVPLQVTVRQIGWFTPSPRPFAELIEGGRALTIGEFLAIDQVPPAP